MHLILKIKQSQLNTKLLKPEKIIKAFYASLLLAKGIPMKEIQEWLGHSTYSTTANIYAHLEKATKNKSANVLSNTLTFADI